MYIAIDGGGTKTEYLLLDKHFQVVDYYLGTGNRSLRQRMPLLLCTL